MTRRNRGFTLLELMIAMVVTLVITGAMYGLMAQGQTAFRREPALMDRQQQIRISMDRVQTDVVGTGSGLGSYFQSLGAGLNAVGVAGGIGAEITGVRAAGDALLGGGLPDALDLRSVNTECPQAAFTKASGAANFSAAGFRYPPCFHVPATDLFAPVVVIFTSANAKMGVMAQDPAGLTMAFPAAQNTVPLGSQMINNENAHCDFFLPVGTHCPGDPAFGVPAPAAPALPNYYAPATGAIAKLDRVMYRLGIDVDPLNGARTPSLFRSGTGGFDPATGAFNTLPPGPAWQLVARGIEDMQVEYRTANGWFDILPAIVWPSYDNVVREVRVTLWARTIGLNNLAGQTTAVGNGVTAVRGSLTTSIAPRAAQVALLNETDVNKRWQ